MIFPVSDDNTGRLRTPYVTYAIIFLNVAVFVLLQGVGRNEKFKYAFATVPQEIRTGRDIARDVPGIVGNRTETLHLQPTPISVYLTLLTSMFMHGGILHILGNMLYLWIFGDNVEDDLTHGRYAVFYLATGVIASLAHVVSTFAFGDNPFVASLGASGAISGVMGGYLVLHPHRRVHVLVVRVATDVPASVAVGAWFLFQLIGALGVWVMGPRPAGGVAFTAHIAGFIAGVLLVRLFLPEGPLAIRRRAVWSTDDRS